MTVRTTCKNCGRRLKGSDSLLGKTVPCPNCGEPIHIVGERDTGAGGQDEPAAPVAARSPHGVGEDSDAAAAYVVDRELHFALGRQVKRQSFQS